MKTRIGSVLLVTFLSLLALPTYAAEAPAGGILVELVQQLVAWGLGGNDLPPEEPEVAPIPPANEAPGLGPIAGIGPLLPYGG